MSKQLSSRVQGLKFMQRGPVRPASEPESSPGPSTPAATPTKDAAPSEPAAQEQWVVPSHARVARPRPAAAPSTHWDTWLSSALDESSDTKPTSRRQVFGQWSKPRRHAESEDELESDDEYASAPSSPETGFRKPPSANTPRAKRGAPSHGERQRKLAAVASSQDGVRKKPQKKDAVRRLR